MYIDIDENITGMQDGRTCSLVIDEPPRIAKNVILFHIVTHLWKTGC